MWIQQTELMNAVRVGCRIKGKVNSNYFGKYCNYFVALNIIVNSNQLCLYLTKRYKVKNDVANTNENSTSLIKHI